VVSIVIQANSLPDFVNAGLTVRHYKMKGEEAKVYFLSEAKSEEFWSRIEKYVDKRDRSLIILNFPLPSKEILESINLEPYEYSILYIPSILISMTPQSKKTLLEKGIVFMPQRAIYKCFPGEYIDQVEKRWMSINQAISFESELEYKKDISIIVGLLKMSQKDPHLTIDKIANNDLEFFGNLGKESIPEIHRYIERPNLGIGFTESSGVDLIQIALGRFFSDKKIKKTLIGIKGKKGSLILTASPTFADHIFNKDQIKARHIMNFGKGAALLTDQIDDTSISLLVGRLSQQNVFIEFHDSKFVVKKTLLRKLMGGKGPGGRIYKGLKETFPEIDVKKDMIKTPIAAFENVIDTLKETGTEFRIIS
jgi:hypothetical protein